ncbi:nickel ABC transporter substrate-binding protein [Pseudomonas tohonis]|uniref:Nickel ABC transporter substrate-binding protein n=1 Tax=Pseudomonas tohonis TaxID=2725477 RepID=A0A6J4DZM7_9PSED|nr:DUF4198 domain-containing protein [Pseudomonas tohonis]BCG23113.1 nickel ABC transporter substrate-binding protein [Pseudomonas tohonis]GJN53200.1 nickel ABC transporter substrate-binding protein [Pseudomonas tohonis]
MRLHSKLLLTAALGALLAGQAQAHGLWTEQRRGNIEVIYGHGAEDDAFKAEKVSGAWAYDAAGKMIPVTIQRLDDHARLQPLTPPASLAVALDNGAWSQTADKQWINKGRDQVKDAVASIHTWKYSLAIYREGAKLPTMERLRLVIVPQVDPLAVGPGKPLPVQVLMDGKPAAGIELFGDYRSDPHTVSATTDAQGKAKVLVRNAGLNVIAAQATVKSDKDPEAEEHGFFTSLTFVGEAHHE